MTMDSVSVLVLCAVMHSEAGVSARPLLLWLRRMGVDLKLSDLSLCLGRWVSAEVFKVVSGRSGQLRYVFDKMPLGEGQLSGARGFLKATGPQGRSVTFVCRRGSYTPFGEPASRGTMKLAEVVGAVGLSWPDLDGFVPLNRGLEAARVSWRPHGPEVVLEPCDLAARRLVATLGRGQHRVDDLLEGRSPDEALMFLWTIQRLRGRGVVVDSDEHVRVLERRPSYKKLLALLLSAPMTESELVKASGVKRKYARELLLHMVRHEVVLLRDGRYVLAALGRRRLGRERQSA